MSSGIMILAIFGAIILIPLVIVLIVFSIIISNRRKKIDSYQGETEGTIIRIQRRGMDYADIIHVSYSVNGVDYEIKESAKLKTEMIKAGSIPIGQRKTYVLGNIKEGDSVRILYDENRPQKAIIVDNEGIMNT